MQVLRLKKRRDFLRAAKKGHKIVMPGLVMQIVPTPPAFLKAQTDPTVRIGFTVTKKVGNAVVRNRVRRRLKEAVRLTLSDASLIGHDLVFIGRARGEACPFDKLSRDVARALDKALKKISP